MVIVRRYKQGLKCLRAGYLTSTYFHYNGKHYKQLHGTAMGSPVSVVVAEIVMQNIEEQALAIPTRELYLFGYVTLTIHSPPYTNSDRGTQRLFSVKYLFGEAIIA